jgi:lipoprotein-anchoring transpeptidase ErfK/SrfK
VQAKTIDSIGPSRRTFLLGAASLGGMALSGCSAMVGSREMTLPNLLPAVISPYYLQIYDAMPEERFPVPAVNLNKVDQRYLRTEVDDPTGAAPGSIVVETSQRYLYLVRGGGVAIRYGVGIGRDGFTWSGRGYIGRKAQWPTWHPTSAMMDRQPETREYAGGMPGGLNNPLGARAMYIYRDGVDTIYRIHGTREYWSIGKAVSSGCVRLINQDVIDLYSRVAVGTPIIVRG